ncbi:hypothetical protein Hanom_Chr13g01226181 [Helianthus anomalus]
MIYLFFSLLEKKKKKKKNNKRIAFCVFPFPILVTKMDLVIICITLRDRITMLS